jgi:hypothetical protein
MANTLETIYSSKVLILCLSLNFFFLGLIIFIFGNYNVYATLVSILIISFTNQTSKSECELLLIHLAVPIGRFLSIISI